MAALDTLVNPPFANDPPVKVNLDAKVVGLVVAILAGLGALFGLLALLAVLGLGAAFAGVFFLAFIGLLVGVVGDVRSGGPAQEVTPEFYLPIAQVPAVAWGWSQRTMTVVVRGAAGDAAALAPVIRAVVREIDPTVPVYSLATMEQQLGKSLAEDRFHMLLLAVLGVVGLLLAAAGIYSVIAYFASLRSHEIGVRMALGATAADILGLMAWQGLRPVLAGTALGSVAAWWAARLLAGALHGVRPTDPATFAVTAGLLVAVGLAASWIPARRAAAGDPSRVLHG